MLAVRKCYIIGCVPGTERRLMSTFVLAFLIGVVAGLRSMTAPAAVSWAARLGWLHLENTWLAFLGFAATPYAVSVLAIGELITDKLPKTPSRKAPVPFIGRIVIGALCGLPWARLAKLSLPVC
jgi:uncharacterized membrane protein